MIVVVICFVWQKHEQFEKLIVNWLATRLNTVFHLCQILNIFHYNVIQFNTEDFLSRLAVSEQTFEKQLSPLRGKRVIYGEWPVNQHMFTYAFNKGPLKRS